MDLCYLSPSLFDESCYFSSLFIDCVIVLVGKVILGKMRFGGFKKVILGTIKVGWAPGSHTRSNQVGLEIKSGFLCNSV